MSFSFFRLFINQLRRHKLIACINVIGLTFGIGAFLLLMLYVDDEFSWDRHWEDADRIVRLTGTAIQSGGRFSFSTPPAVAREQLMEAFPDSFERSARAALLNGEMRGDQSDESVRSRLLLVDPDYAEIFELNVVLGSMATTLEAPYRVALTEEEAARLFGSTQILGRVVTLTGSDGVPREFQVTAVLRKPAARTNLLHDSISLLDPTVQNGFVDEMSTWKRALQARQYFLLKPGEDLAGLNARMDAFTDRYAEPPFGERVAGRGVHESLELRFQKLTDVHFNPLVGEKGNDPLKVTIFASIAILVLLVGIVNYMILTNAQNADRRREIGVRKSLGASDLQLLLQFIGESLIYSGAAVVVALVFVEMLLPIFSSLLGSDVAATLSIGRLMGFAVASMLVAGVLGGIYPGMVLSRCRPQQVLRGNPVHTPRTAVTTRYLLLSFQFAIAIALVMAMFTLHYQLRLAQDHDPGFIAEEVVGVGGFNNGPGQDRAQSLQNEICNLGQVLECSTGTRFVNSLNGSYPFYSLTSRRTDDNVVNVTGVGVGLGFMGLYQIRLLAGRDFDATLDLQNAASTLSGDATLDKFSTERVILNRSAARALGYSAPEQIVGTEIYLRMLRQDGSTNYHPLEVIGVVEDNQLLSLRERPTAIAYNLFRPEHTWFITAKLVPGRLAEFQQQVREIWTAILGAGAPRFELADINMANEFERERNESRLLLGFAALAILVACLGLYGIVTLELRRRVKEIGIRKTLGADVRAIVLLFVAQFSRPVLLANLLAWPVAVWGLLNWLSRFPYQIEHWLLYLLGMIAGLMAWLLASVAVSASSAKAAMQKPVDSLRYE